MAACVGPCAPALSFGDLESLWINAGGPIAVAPIAAAIAAAESSGIPNNTNPTDNGGSQTSWGLWQVSDGTHNAYVANWSDPAANAAAAVAKFKAAGGFSPWGTFTSGAYLAHLHDANANGTMGTGAATTTPASSSSSAFSASALSAQTSTLVIVFAALVLLIGIWAMTRPAGPKMAPA